MDQAQFTAFTEGVAHMFGTLDEGMNRRHNDMSNRDRLRTITQSIRICDGNVPAEVREWIEEVEMARSVIPVNVIGAMIQIATRTVAGPLKREVERFLQAQPNRMQTPWATLRDHIRTAFLSANEDERLKSELEKLTQSSYENLGVYNRKFREAAIKAYPGAWSPDAERTILRAYTRGLYSSELAKRLIVENRPTTLDGAIAFTEQQEAGLEMYRGIDRKSEEEPMDVNQVRTQDLDKLFTVMQNCAKSQDKLANRLAKLEGANLRTVNPIPVPRVPRSNQPTVGSGSKIRCYYCSKLGHKMADCYQKKVDTRTKQVPTAQTRLN